MQPAGAMQMANIRVDVGAGPGLFELFSYARPGPARRDRLSPESIALVSRTVNRTPEVMVKVLTQGGRSLGSVGAHLNYLSRSGRIDLETDDGQITNGKGAVRELLDDWDLELDERRRTADLRSCPPGRAPKLVHKLMFSMPAGTPPTKVLEAVRALAREEFALSYRYAMALHTNEPHPHVHVVVKAMGQDGRRLNIRKATLRRWRQEFARHLRDRGVPANATDRVARGVSKTPKRDGIYRAALRGDSTHDRQRTEAVARSLRQGTFEAESGKATLLATRREVIRGWRAVRDQLLKDGQIALAQTVERFTDGMPPPLTDNERVKLALTSAAKRIRGRNAAAPDREAGHEQPRSRDNRTGPAGSGPDR
jgi:hypothetical protein